jgi:predicted nucleic acid-binding Zn ribbon protein
MNGEYNSTHSMKNLVDELIKKLGWTEKVYAQRIIEDWAELVGEAIANYSKVDDLREKTLFINCNNSVWRSELSIRKEEILKRINEKYAMYLVDNIVIR